MVHRACLSPSLSRTAFLAFSDTCFTFTFSQLTRMLPGSGGATRREVALTLPCCSLPSDTSPTCPSLGPSSAIRCCFRSSAGYFAPKALMLRNASRWGRSSSGKILWVVPCLASTTRGGASLAKGLTMVSLVTPSMVILASLASLGMELTTAFLVVPSSAVMRSRMASPRMSPMARAAPSSPSGSSPASSVFSCTHCGSELSEPW